MLKIKVKNYQKNIDHHDVPGKWFRVLFNVSSCSNKKNKIQIQNLNYPNFEKRPGFSKNKIC